ncbi:MAG: hypothetical protein UU24_C0003G0009 [Candidatus Nomurabacteria bacterium GW2011_GWA2_40_9]|uniref:Uncharacterized protein n=1 Tax=Candidatus Nomurabacteria bacterium GW2011_GWA2_40_9 TaxID=1618734 RepID=A0A0G0TRV2_9BACT|nr:MAG: hypothetical protein UU24_C0003G0009 [Candidatus Nomurabacteria bacterium GW2011_GWA2_40_9]
MSYDDEEVLAEDSLKEDDDDLLDPLADEAINDFRFDEDEEDPDDSFH